MRGGSRTVVSGYYPDSVDKTGALENGNYENR